MKNNPFDFDEGSSESDEHPQSTMTTFFLEEKEISRLIEEAKVGNSESAFRIYQHYELSVRDEVKSQQWEQASAVLGHKIAQYNIALNFYEKGMLGFSLFWCDIAKNNGHSKAHELECRISKKLML
ncbi:hypothetical protein ACSV5M_04965 [Cellvibrio sp. ARAG 10.3]|uniref:hypothetical protein n=1 Tax=Cellvibrio sp. ARAG 10.3 TaxID=3451358 RepID=UPI003F477952